MGRLNRMKRQSRRLWTLMLAKSALAAEDRAWSPSGTQRPPARPRVKACHRVSLRRQASWRSLQARSSAASTPATYLAGDVSWLAPFNHGTIAGLQELLSALAQLPDNLSGRLRLGYQPHRLSGIDKGQIIILPLDSLGQLLAGRPVSGQRLRMGIPLVGEAIPQRAAREVGGPGYPLGNVEGTGVNRLCLPRLQQTRPRRLRGLAFRRGQQTGTHPDPLSAGCQRRRDPTRGSNTTGSHYRRLHRLQHDLQQRQGA